MSLKRKQPESQMASESSKVSKVNHNIENIDGEFPLETWDIGTVTDAISKTPEFVHKLDSFQRRFDEFGINTQYSAFNSLCLTIMRCLDQKIWENNDKNIMIEVPLTLVHDNATICNIVNIINGFEEWRVIWVKPFASLGPKLINMGIFGLAEKRLSQEQKEYTFLTGKEIGPDTDLLLLVPFEKQLQDRGPRMCVSCGNPEDNHHYRHPFRAPEPVVTKEHLPILIFDYDETLVDHEGRRYLHTQKMLCELKKTGHRIYLCSFNKNAYELSGKAGLQQYFDGHMCGFPTNDRFKGGMVEAMAKTYNFRPFNCIFFDDRSFNISDVMYSYFGEVGPLGVDVNPAFGCTESDLCKGFDMFKQRQLATKDGKVHLKIIVGSGNPDKIVAVKKAFSHALISAFVGAQSGVSSQPIGYDETIQGAINRMQGCHTLNPDADLYIGIENGLIPLHPKTIDNGNIWVDLAMIVLECKKGIRVIVPSAGVPIDSFDGSSESLLQHQTFLSTVNNKATEHFSGHTVTRVQLMQQAVEIARGSHDIRCECMRKLH